MRLPFRFTLVALVLLLFSTAVWARVVRVEVLSRTAGGGGELPAYEKISARVYFAVRPGDAHGNNQAIVDLDKAQKNGKGEVEFSADLFLMRPVGAGNGALLLEIPNRGGKGMLQMLDGGKADPTNADEVGDGWLLRQGFTFAALGWQWDVADAPGNLRLYAPIAHEKNGGHITGLLRDDFTPNEPMTDVPLGHIMGDRLGGTEYAPADPASSRNVLTVRDTPHGQRKVIPRDQWNFTHSGKSTIVAKDYIHFAAGFVPGKIYELVYVVQDPVVAGLGFAAVRDFVAWLKHSPDAIAPVHVAYAAGISQCGRFLRDLMYEGFNADEENRIALDGVLAHVGGAGRGSFNYRFAQPSRDAQPMSSIDWPTDIFPYTDLPETDPHHPGNGKLGLLDAARAKQVVPKIFFSHTSHEYWGRAASLIHTTADAKADAAISDSARIYFYSGLQHASAPFPPQMGSGDRAGQQLPSPLPMRFYWRAMVANMDAWVRKGTAPPASRYPHIADGTLVALDKLAFPAVPGFHPPADAAEGWDLDFGPNWRGGILSEQPPAVVGAYPTLVPQVDVDGNDLGGIALPEMTVPLAMYTGWNLRNASIGAPTQRLALTGSFLPFHATKAAAEASHDPRLSIADRYKSYDEYRGRFEKALDGLIAERYLLPEDKSPLMKRSEMEWKWFTRDGEVPK